MYISIYIYMCVSLWTFMRGSPEAAPNHRHQRPPVGLFPPLCLPASRWICHPHWRTGEPAARKLANLHRRFPPPTSDLHPPPPRPTNSSHPPTGRPPPTDRPCPGSPPRSKPGAGRDKTAGGHHPRPVAGCCLRRGAAEAPIGPRGLSCRGHPAKGPCRQFPRDLRISQHRTASA